MNHGRCCRAGWHPQYTHTDDQFSPEISPRVELPSYADRPETRIDRGKLRSRLNAGSFGI
jgi:hypothetical protein